MNLGQAKLILIIAFTGLNVFLGYQLFWPDFGRLTEVAVTTEQLRETEQKMEENNYILETQINRSQLTSDFITVTPSWEIRQELLYQLIKSGVQIERIEHMTYYHADDMLAIIHTSGLIQLFYHKGISLEDEIVELDENDLAESVKSYLAVNNLLPENITFDYMEKISEGRLALKYHQHLDDVPIFSGQVKVILEDKKINAVEIYWLDPSERSPKREMEVISSAEALNNLVSELGPSAVKRHITKIDLGYYSGEYDAEKWEVPPVWRIVFDNKQYYYINAFTGNLEKDIVIPDQL